MKPLPPVPEPPSFGPDPRQETFYTIVGALVPQLSGTDGEVRVAATSTGFPASAVDLGRLQSEMERAFAGWSANEIRSRWRDEVFLWIAEFTRRWVQRRSMARITRTRLGFRIVLDTKDDHGYYHYVFEVVLRRRPSPKTPFRDDGAK